MSAGPEKVRKTAVAFLQSYKFEARNPTSEFDRQEQVGENNEAPQPKTC